MDHCNGIYYLYVLLSIKDDGGISFPGRDSRGPLKTRRYGGHQVSTNDLIHGEPTVKF